MTGVQRYRIRLYHWSTRRLQVEETLDPADNGILRERLEALVRKATGRDNPDLRRWWTRVLALNGRKVAECRVDPAGRTVVKR
jgi:hypothetical protein